MANGTVVSATGKRTVPVDVSRLRILLTNGHYIPDFHTELVSCTRFDGPGITTVIFRD